MRFVHTLVNRFIDLLNRPSLRYRCILPLADLLSKNSDEEILRKSFDFVSNSGVEGDYLEFGVWKGRSFSRAFNIWKYFFARKGRLKDLRFFALDSFEGLPGSSGEFKKGQYYCSEKDFTAHIKSHGVDMTKVGIIPGWFDKSLNQGVKDKFSLQKAAVIFIDCDLYESTVPVLEFITDIVQDGTIIVFDDWFCFKGHPGKGEQLAFKEWLAKNQNITATEWHKVNWKSNSFILHKQ